MLSGSLLASHWLVGGGGGGGVAVYRRARRLHPAECLVPLKRSPSLATVAMESRGSTQSHGTLIWW